MHRRARDNCSFSGGRDEDPIPTQEYIKRVLENGDDRDDDDFRANPWLSALDFLRKEGARIHCVNIFVNWLIRVSDFCFVLASD